jgi:hypothetical protein
MTKNDQKSINFGPPPKIGPQKKGHFWTPPDFGNSVGFTGGPFSESIKSDKFLRESQPNQQKSFFYPKNEFHVKFVKKSIEICNFLPTRQIPRSFFAHENL